MDKAIEQQVWHRAGNACEYCRIPQALCPTMHEIDHVIARQHEGLTELDNLALACLHCNLHKGPNIASIDQVSKQLVRLFNPRTDIWTDHFIWEGALLVGRTSIGHATVKILAINRADYLDFRRSLFREGRFPQPLTTNH
jgi:hypothetical protein